MDDLNLILTVGIVLCLLFFPIRYLIDLDRNYTKENLDKESIEESIRTGIAKGFTEHHWKMNTTLFVVILAAFGFIFLFFGLLNL